MFISSAEDFDIFLSKHIVTGDIDPDLLKIWLVGNEVLNYKQNQEILYFLIGEGKPGRDERYRELSMVSYNIKTDKATINEKFKVKNITFTENIDLFQNLFAYYSNCGAILCDTSTTSTSTTDSSSCVLNEIEIYNTLQGETTFEYTHTNESHISVYYNGRLLPTNDWDSNTDHSQIILAHSVISDGDVVVIRECRTFEFADVVDNDHLTNSIYAAFSSLYIGSY